ncbi:MAG TPA: class I SAM-dependent methyltransferase [Burkholderiales bacterium]|nr:class I SAM-dependent methyltransferase [Burkholderiales bacterium]
MRPYLRTRDLNRDASDEEFRYERCPDCGLASLANAPADLGRYYAAGYHEIPASAEGLERGAAHDSYKIDLVRQFATRGRLVEIGPGWGAFCLLARRAGFEVEAIERDPRCCEFLQKELGVRAIRSDDPATALAQAATADAIVLWHVVEHLADPWAVLEAAARKLAPGGVLLIATPNPESFQLGLFGRFWTHVDAPRHLHLIPVRLLRSRMARLGLDAELATTTDPGSIGWNDFGWRFSLANLAPHRALKRPLRLAGRVLGKLAALIDNREGRGSAYTAVFRKR